MNAEHKLAEVVVAVGTDHHPFDRLVEWVDRWAASRPEVRVVIQRGTSQPATHCDSPELLRHAELCELFAMATVVVSHGGPSTVMDARRAGRLPIVVARNPAHGEHVDEHQMRFADHLDRHDVARVVDEEADLHAALDEALARPEGFAVTLEEAAAAGVIEFGRRLDQLLGAVTPIVPTSPADLPGGATDDESTTARPDRSPETATVGDDTGGRQ